MMRTLLLLTLAGLVSSCSPVYKASLVNPPVFSDMGQVQAQVGYGTGGINGAVAASITPNVFAGVSGYYNQRQNSFSTADPYSDENIHYYFDLQVGYFKSLGEHGRFSFSGGMGSGYGQATDQQTWGGPGGWTERGRYLKPYIQPHIGISSEFLDFGFLARVGYVTFEQYYNSGSTHFGSYEVNGAFLEPVAYFNLGYKYVKLMMQGGLAINMLDAEFDHDPIILGVGLQFQFMEPLFNRER